MHIITNRSRKSLYILSQIDQGKAYTLLSHIDQGKAYTYYHI
jgi:hypothetical protein